MTRREETTEGRLEEEVGRLLGAAGSTVAVAESCTGGLLAERLTRMPGSSAYFLGGVVAYADRVKTALLGVADELIARDGAVSEQVARAMASGVRARVGSDWGIGITGIAGPGGGSRAKPVGRVDIALAGPGGQVVYRRVQLAGDREAVRQRAAELALELLRDRLRPGVGS